MYSLMGMVAGLTANCGPLCSKDFSSGVSSFLERLITHLSWILEELEEVTAVLKVLVVFLDFYSPTAQPSMVAVVYHHTLAKLCVTPSTIDCFGKALYPTYSICTMFTQ